jgi:outer membrane protein assembly factor BamB
MRRSIAAATVAAWALIGVNIALAQRGAGDWMTSAYDAQRSSWVRADVKISPQSMQKPGFELVWKVKFDNAARQLNSLTAPALLDFYIGYRGFRTLGFFGGSSDKIIGVDTDLARTEWEKSLAPAGAAAGTLPCPGGMTSAVTRPTLTSYPPVPTGQGFGRGTPAKSGVGEPHEGAVTLKTMAPPPPPPPRPPASAKPGAGAEAPPNPFAPRVQYVLALSSDGKLHSMYVSNGHEANPAVPFLPPNAHAQGLIAFGNTAYVATTNSCGGVENGVWALDMTTKKVSQWKTSAKSVAGTAGPAAGPDGKLYAAAGSELTALTPRTLDPLATYKISGAEFTSSPVVFEFKGKDLIAVTSSDGRLHLLDAGSLGSGTPLARSEPFSSPSYEAGSVTSWQDPSGNRWLLAAAGGAVATKAGFPANNGAVKSGSIAAWKVVDKNGAAALEPAWLSRDLVSPLPPIIVNGVVFALSSGEFRSADAQMTAAQRAQKSSPAVLYALDSSTGKELWNSGASMTSFVHTGGLAAGGSRVYVSTYDGTQYAFGYPIEH